MHPQAMLLFCAVMLCGMWLERFLLMVPSLWQGEGVPLGLLEFLITLGFFGLVALCVLLFLQRYPLFPIGDPFFQAECARADADGGQNAEKEGRA